MCQSFSSYFRRRRKLISALLSFFLLGGMVAEMIVPSFVLSQSIEESKAELRNRLQNLQAQINEYRAKIQATSQKEATLQNQISLLDNKIKKLNLEIESLQIAIGDTQRRIAVIEKTNQQIERNIRQEREVLAKTLKMVYENDRLNYVELFFKKKKLSDIFADLKAIQELQGSLLSSLNEIRVLRQKLETEKKILQERQDDFNNLKKMQEIQTRALLLAMLKKESEWGTNVGRGTWRQDMHPRDQNAFLAITKELNLNPDLTPVSRKPSYGWGGAMGPAQFLPNTWLAYKDEIARLTGHNPPNPWDIGDAFMACAIKLRDAGAAAQTYRAEWKAAQIYFAGRRWNNPRYYFYGDSVMELANKFQHQIDILEHGST